ncbi:MAG: ABC transporter permease [Anaerolineales bacterium]|nr:ABC transporter permease [Anaerolineales bacterium]
MTDTAATAPHPAVPRPATKPRRTLREWLTRNPVVLKELRGRMRGARAFIVLTVYLLLMSGLITLLYTLYVSTTSSVYSASDRQLLGKLVFGSMVVIEMLLVCFITPAFTVGAISGERERQTYDLLRTTLLSERAFVLGKLISALLYVFILLLAALPLQSLAFLVGGVAVEEILVATLLLLTVAFLFGAAGVFCSSMMRRTLGATVLTYAFVLLATLGPLALLFSVMIFVGTAQFLVSPPVELQIVLLYLFGLLIATNPVATLIATEVILVSNQTLFYFTAPIYDPTSGNSINVPLISPWIPYVLFALGLGVVFTFLSIANVARRER